MSINDLLENTKNAKFNKLNYAKSYININYIYYKFSNFWQINSRFFIILIKYFIFIKN